MDGVSDYTTHLQLVIVSRNEMLNCGIATEKVGLEPQMFGIEASVGNLVSCSEAVCPAMLINGVSISWSFAVELFTDREFGESERC